MIEDVVTRALNSYLETTKEKEMSVAEEATFTKAELDQRISSAEREAVNRYKNFTLVPLIKQYAERHGLCDDGVKNFCHDAGIEITNEYSAHYIVVIHAESVEAYDEDEAHEMHRDNMNDFIRQLRRNGYTVDPTYCEVQDIELE